MMSTNEYNPAEHPRDLTDKAFRISLYAKGIHGVFEILVGFILLIIKPEQISHLADSLTRGELSQDQHDFIATHILKFSHDLTGSALIFAGIYLLAHGFARVVLVVEVFRDKLWAYIGLIVFTSGFLIYQIYRLAFVKFSVLLTLVSLLDIVVIYLTQKEYRRHRARLHHTSES